MWASMKFLPDLGLNSTRRSINLLVFLVFNLEARRLKFLGENLLGVVENELSILGSMLYLVVTYQNAQICQFEPQKFCNEQTHVECIISIFSESLRISLDKTYAGLRGMHINLQRNHSR